MNESLIILSFILLAAIALVLWLNQYKTIKEFYDNGTLRGVYRLKNGKKQGVERIYYRSGELNKEKSWHHGLLIGKAITYYKTGEKYIIDSYSEGERIDTIVLNSAMGCLSELGGNSL